MLQGNKKQHFSIRKLTIGAASVLIGVSMFALGNKANAAAGEIPVKGVAHLNVIKKHPNWKINMLNGEGKYTNKYIKTNSNWKVFAKATINGETMYRLGSDSQWVPAKYLTFNRKAAASEVKAPKALADNVVYAPVINHNSNWKIALLNDKGQYTGNYIPTNSTWKVFAAKNINGRTMYRLGTNDQWVPADFVTGNVTFSVEEAKKDDTKPVENQKPTENKNTNNNSNSSTVTTPSDNTGSTTTTPSSELATKEDKDVLKQLIREVVSEYKDTTKYGNATPASKKKFDDALAKAEKTLNDPKATKQETESFGMAGKNNLFTEGQKLDGKDAPAKESDAAKNPAKYPAKPVAIIDYQEGPIIGAPWDDAKINILKNEIKEVNPAVKKINISSVVDGEKHASDVNVYLVYADGSMNRLNDKSKLFTQSHDETIADKVKKNLQLPSQKLEVVSVNRLTPQETQKIYMALKKSNSDTFTHIFSSHQEGNKYVFTFSDGSDLAIPLDQLVQQKKAITLADKAEQAGIKYPADKKMVVDDLNTFAKKGFNDQQMETFLYDVLPVLENKNPLLKGCKASITNGQLLLVLKDKSNISIPLSVIAREK